ncbi:DEAD/DEAH box helicase, partial [Alkalihalophilus lindianensis]|nr:DEAD/DEAH box helicase [Alkalihalophilus lindianensis]
IELDDRNRLRNRVKHAVATEMLAKSITKKPKKVKPGYKKKMQAEMEKVKKRQRRMNQKKR